MERATLIEIPRVSPPSARPDLVRRARRLAWFGLSWHLAEAGIAVAAGVVAGSIALVGFGADSMVEAVAAVVVLWRFAASRHESDAAEDRAQKLIAASFFLIAVYIGVEAIRTLIGGHHPDPSWVGIGLAAVTILVMPPLARAKSQVAHELGSSATHSEGRQNLLCAYLSAGLLVGLGLNAVAGWWWADPITALAIAGVAVREGRDSWRGEGCCEAC